MNELVIFHYEPAVTLKVFIKKNPKKQEDNKHINSL